MKNYKYKIVAIFTVLNLVLDSCNSGGQKGTSENKKTEVIPEDIVELRFDQIKTANIQLGTIEMQSLSGKLKVNGTVAVAPQNMATVCMPMGGFVKSTSLMPGNVVEKGQTLAILENQEFVDIQQNYLEAKNKFEFAEADYQRHAELFKNDVYSQQSLQQVTSDYKNLKAQVRALGQKLSLIGINPANLKEETISSAIAVISPISGFVKSSRYSPGTSSLYIASFLQSIINILPLI